MNRILCASVSLGLMVAGTAAFAADVCEKLTATGHPQYPVIAFKHGDRIDGAAAMLVEAVGKELNIPVESKYTGSWADAQQAARDGKVDIIFGIYYNDERAAYLDYIQPAFIYDPVVVFVAKGKAFPLADQEDLIAKKGVTNQGESYGTDFDAFIKDKLTVARSNGVDAAFNDLLAGKADYLIAGYYPGLAEAARLGIKDEIEALNPALLSPEMFVAFSKKSPCLPLAANFGKAITEMTTDGRFSEMLTKAIETWDAAQEKKN